MSLLLLLQSGGSPVTLHTHTFTLLNVGDADLHVGSVELELLDGTTAFAIISDTASGSTLAAQVSDPDTGEVTTPGGTATIRARFQPTVAGPALAIIHVPSDDPSGTLDITLQGEGILAAAPAILVDPASAWAAGSVLVAGGSATRLVTVTNTGTADLVIGTVALTGSSFAKSADGVNGATIAPGAHATLLLTFDPSSSGAKTGSLTIPSNAGASVVIALSGTGTVVAPSPTLVTRWYLGRQADPSSIVVAASGWAQNDFASNRFLLATSKAGAAPSLATVTKATANNDRTVGVARYVSPPLAAQDLRDMAIRCYALTGRQAALGANVTAAIRFARYRAASSVLYASSVLASATAVSPWEANTAGLRETRRFPAGESWSAHLPSTSDWVFESGDRLVVDVGARVLVSATGTVSISLGGSASATDMDATQTNTDDTQAPWIEFADGLLVLP